MVLSDSLRFKILVRLLVWFVCICSFALCFGVVLLSIEMYFNVLIAPFWFSVGNTKLGLPSQADHSAWDPQIFCQLQLGHFD